MPDTQLITQFRTDRPRSVRTAINQTPEPALLDSLDYQLESDRGRIINSAAVRRLQQKTQVFPLELNAAVRSRLTHSLEVQQTGRFITRAVFAGLRDQQAAPELLALEPQAISLVEMACLLHDVGNPPFGHFGEEAISRWFRQHLAEVPALSKPLDDPEAEKLRGGLVRELQQFEGNAQAIRLVVHLQRLNLTYLQTACILKYTRCATDIRPDDTHPDACLQKKPGYYFSEQAFVRQLWETLNLPAHSRFALTYLMEAADDISYGLADLEDGVDKGILDYPSLAAELKQDFRERYPIDPDGLHFQGQSFDAVIDAALHRAEAEEINKAHEFFVWLRVGLIHPLVKSAAQEFITHFEAIVQGQFKRALLENASATHAAVTTLKKVAQRQVFNTAEVSTLELQGYRILTGLLDHYRPLLTLSDDAFRRLQQQDNKGLLLESYLFRRLPNKHLRAYQQQVHQQQQLGAGHLPPQVWEAYCRCRLLQDMVSGMTDAFALDEYRTLSVLS